MTVLKQSSNPFSNVKDMVLRVVHFREKSDTIFNEETEHKISMGNKLSEQYLYLS